MNVVMKLDPGTMISSIFLPDDGRQNFFSALLLIPVDFWRRHVCDVELPASGRTRSERDVQTFEFKEILLGTP